MKKLFVPLFLCLSALLPLQVKSYVYCGFHATGITLTAYHWNSDFWVDILGQEAAKWNAVQPVLTINRLRQASIPLGRDNNNVVGWLNQADLNRVYGLSWTNTVGWTITWKDGNCGRVLESDLFFNPGITLFTKQSQVPYRLGYQEIALHELGHVCTQNHEDRTLAVMTAGASVSDILYASDKVGWYYSARTRLAPTDKRDVGIYPLRNNGSSKIYSTIYPSSVYRGNSITVRDFTLQNLSVGINETNVRFKVYLQHVSTGAWTEIGSFTWSAGGYTSWDGNLTFYIPSGATAGSYKVWGYCQSYDTDYSNSWALFGQISVL
jgi:hypothetical protein